jgi:hypothetical protein
MFVKWIWSVPGPAGIFFNHFWIVLETLEKNYMKITICYSQKSK